MGEAAKRVFQPDGTTRLLWDLIGVDSPVVSCSLAYEQAAAILRTPKGCVARPGDQIQALCNQHLGSWGVIDVSGVGVILDLPGAELAPDDDPAALSLGYTALQLQEWLDSVGLDPSPPPPYAPSPEFVARRG